MKKYFAALALLSAAVFSLRAQTPEFPFRDSSLPVEERIDDFIGRLTLEQKVDMLRNKFENKTGIPGIHAYDWWNEALHGVARAGVATVFPQSMGLAATFDPEEQYRTFTTVSDEARAKYNEAMRNKNYKRYYGLSFWTPNINIVRDPRWGRGQETYGEDPFLTAQMGMATVRGLQGNDPKYYKSHACAKHYAVHSGPEWARHTFDAVVSKRDLWETYLPAFQALVKDAGVREVMGAYNRVYGKPCCASDFLLQEILREKWGFQGMVVSDCSAIRDFYKFHKTHSDEACAAADAVRIGTNVECGEDYLFLTEAVKRGLITEKELDDDLRVVLRSWIELGMLDEKDNTPWADLPFSIVACEDHIRQSREVADKSMVLLKNKGVLPLVPIKVRKLAVIGPNAADSLMLLGNYNGTPNRVVTLLDGIRAAYPNAEVTYERGCDLVEGYGQKITSKEQLPAMGPECYTPEALAALAARASDADAIIFIGGLSPTLEGEESEVKGVIGNAFKGGDRIIIELPEIQGRVLKALHKTGKPVVFVACTGSAIALEQNEKDYDALLCAWYPGQEGGNAVADVLSGKYNPSGHLPITFYKSTAQLPDFMDYSMENRTYRYMKEAPLYAFGYGMSYTKYSDSIRSFSVNPDGSVSVNVRVSNTGFVPGEHCVQVYVKRLKDAEAPIKALKGFQQVFLKPGETKTVTINLPASSFEYYDKDADGLVYKRGDYKILVGSSSRDKDLKAVKISL